MSEFWDKEAIYDEQISPLMTKIIDICKANNLPMVASFQYCNTEENGPGFCTTTLPIDGYACDKIRRLTAAMKPERAYAHAETIVTNPDGSKSISIRRIS